MNASGDYPTRRARFDEAVERVARFDEADGRAGNMELEHRQEKRHSLLPATQRIPAGCPPSQNFVLRCDFAALRGVREFGRLCT